MRRPCEDEGGKEDMLPQGKGHQVRAEAGRGNERFSTRIFGKTQR